MTIALHTTAGAPDYRPWPVVDLSRDARLCQVQNDEMLRFFAQGDRAALRCLDLDLNPGGGSCVVSLSRMCTKVEAIAVRSHHFADATNQMTVRCEAPPREKMLKLRDDFVKASHQAWHCLNRIRN